MTHSVAASLANGTPRKSAPLEGGAAARKGHIPIREGGAAKMRSLEKPISLTKGLLQESISHARDGDIQAAFSKLGESLGKSAQLDRSEVDELVQACAASSLSAGLQVVRLLPVDSCKPYAALLDCCERRRSAQGLRRVVSTMFADPRLQKPFLRTTALIQSLQSLGRMKQLEFAVELFQKEGMSVTRGIYNDVAARVFLNALSTDTPLTFKWFDELQKAGFKPDRIALNTLLKSCMRTTDTQRAAQVVEQLSKQGVKGDEYTFNTLIKLFAYAGEAAKALQVHEKMQEAGFRPSASVWGSLIVVCGQQGFLEKAFSFWTEMKSQGVRLTSDSFHALMNACSAAYQGNRAVALLQEMRDAGLQPGLTTYNIAIKACGSPPGITLSKQQLELGFELFQEMRLQNILPDARSFTALFVLCAQANSGQQAWAAYQELLAADLRQDVQLCTACMAALGSEGMVDEVLVIFDKMVWGPARMKPNEKTYRLVARICRENGRLERALQVYKGMRSKGLKPSNFEFREMTRACAEQALKEGQGSTLPAKMVEVLGISHNFTLDLHRLSAAEARATVLCGLLSLQSAHQAGSELQTDLTIITGIGLHSSQKGGGPKLRKAILQLLSKELHILDECSGSGKEDEPLKRPEVNPGRVVVPQEALQRWLDARHAVSKH